MRLNCTVQNIESCVKQEEGRWVVYLDVFYREHKDDSKLHKARQRIKDFETQDTALKAAQLYVQIARDES